MMKTTDWVRVPREPTDEMQHAGQRYALFRTQARAVYEAMLAAAPSAPQGGGVDALRGLLRGYEKDAVSPERIAIRDALHTAITLLTAQPRTDAAQQGEVVARAVVRDGRTAAMEWLSRVPDGRHDLYTAPPSAPVGVEGWNPKMPPLIGTLADLKDYERPAVEAYGRACARAGRDAALAQQPAAAPFVCTGDEIRCHDGNGCECAMQGKQPAAVDDTRRMDWIAMHGSFGVDSVSGKPGGDGQRRIAATRKNIDNALAGQQQENGNG